MTIIKHFAIFLAALVPVSACDTARECTTEDVPALKISIDCNGVRSSSTLRVEYRLSSEARWHLCSNDISGSSMRCSGDEDDVRLRCSRLTPHGSDGVYVVRATQGTFSAESNDVRVSDGECHANTENLVLQPIELAAVE